MGGQEGDTGLIKAPQGTFRVTETVHLRGDKLGHKGIVESGELHLGDAATLTVDYESRQNTCKNHSATHLLQKALKNVLGDHVEQKGSLVSPTRLRFDFSHFQPMTTEEIRKVEEIVNQEIREGLFVQTDIMSLEDARKTGAMALFGEKYGESVRVVSMGNFSRELCGGTHVNNTADIFCFKIVSEAGIAAGVRRIEALTGMNVIRHLEEEEALLQRAAAAARVTPAEVADHLQKQAAEIRRLQHENEALKSKLAAGQVGNIADNIQMIGSTRLLAASVPDVDGGGLRDLGDQLRDKIGEGVIVLVSEKDGKVSLVVMATEEAQKAGAHAGNLVKEAAALIGGKGGGRPNMAQAGGKDPAGIEALLQAVPGLLQAQLH